MTEIESLWNFLIKHKQMNARLRPHRNPQTLPWAELTWIAQPFNLFRFDLRLKKSFFGRKEIDRRTEEGFQFKDKHMPKTFAIFWISNQHFEIWRLPTSKSIALIKVLGLNGIEVNGVEVKMNQSRLLRDHDIISIASQKFFKFHYLMPIENPQGHPKELTDRYMIGDVLTKGGQGSVRTIYEIKTVDVTDETFSFGNFKLAMKVVKREGNPNVRYLVNEVEYFKELQNHPNIVELVEISLSPSFVFFIMEMCDMDLLMFIMNRDVNRNKKEIAEEIPKIIFYQICRALSHMHSHGIAHRDIKCENILLRKIKLPGDDEITWVAKIGDFGFSKKVEEHLCSQLGTDLYMSPEVMVFEGEYDLSTDIWSLGCVLFALVTGSYPFHHNYHCNGTLKDQIHKGIINWNSQSLVSVAHKHKGHLFN